MVFVVADYDFAIRLSKFKIADAIWRLKFKNVLGIPRIWNKGGLLKISIQRFSMSLIKILFLSFRNLKLRDQYGR